MVPGAGKQFSLTIPEGRWLQIRTLYVGVDVSMKDFKVRYMDDQGAEAGKRRRFENNQPGLDCFVEAILQIGRPATVTRVVIGLEATSVYSRHLQMGLASENRPAPYEPQIYTFNPKVIANFKKAYVDPPKDDWTDAWVIADRLRFLKFNTLSQDEVFSNLFGTTSVALLTEFLSPEEIAARPLENLIDEEAYWNRLIRSLPPALKP